MADRTNADMLILEFLSVTKPSRRHEVKNDLTHSWNTTTASFAHDSASQSSPFTSTVGAMSHSSSAVFCNITRSVYDENLGLLQLLKILILWMTLLCRLLTAARLNTRALLACWPRLSVNARDPGWHEKWRRVGTPDVWSANRSPSWTRN